MRAQPQFPNTESPTFSDAETEVCEENDGYADLETVYKYNFTETIPHISYIHLNLRYQNDQSGYQPAASQSSYANTTHDVTYYVRWVSQEQDQDYHSDLRLSSTPGAFKPLENAPVHIKPRLPEYPIEVLVLVYVMDQIQNQDHHDNNDCHRMNKGHVHSLQVAPHHGNRKVYHHRRHVNLSHHKTNHLPKRHISSRPVLLPAIMEDLPFTSNASTRTSYAINTKQCPNTLPFRRTANT